MKRKETRLTTPQIPIIVEAKIKAMRKRSKRLELTERNVRGLEDILMGRR